MTEDSVHSGNASARAWEPERLTVVRTRKVMVRPSPRVYTRRRIMVAVLLTVLVLAGWLALRELGSIAALPAPEASQPMTRIAAPSYVAQSGDTYWSIARRLDPDGDPRPLVDRLVAANGGATLRAGDVIVVTPATRS